MTRIITTVGPDSLDQVDVYVDGQPTLLALTADERRELVELLVDEPEEAPGVLVSANVTIFERDDQVWLQIAGSLFGPFSSKHRQWDAIAAIPAALNSLD